MLFRAGKVQYLCCGATRAPPQICTAGDRHQWRSLGWRGNLGPKPHEDESRQPCGPESGLAWGDCILGGSNDREPLPAVSVGRVLTRAQAALEAWGARSHAQRRVGALLPSWQDRHAEQSRRDEMLGSAKERRRHCHALASERFQEEGVATDWPSRVALRR